MKITDLKYILFACLFFVSGLVFAQNSIEGDSIPNHIHPERSTDLAADDESSMVSSDFLERDHFSPSAGDPERAVTLPKYEIDPAAKFYFNHETVSILPYQYSFHNAFEGLTMQGVNARFVLNDYVTANMNMFVSSVYFGPFQPNPYFNSTLRMNLVFKVHDRVQLVGLGQVSVREGINPALSSFHGGANYYGAGMQIKVTDKVGFGFGVTNSYYRKNWTARPYVMPVFYPF